MNLNYTRPYLECFWCDGRCSYMNRCDQKAVASCPAPQILNVSCAALGEKQLQSEVRGRDSSADRALDQKASKAQD